MRTILVSYDRGLLDPSSEVFRRVSSLAQDGLEVTALVISSGGHAMVSSGGFSAVGFSGNGFVRALKAAHEGIRLARQRPGKTVVSAQDPFVAGVIGYRIKQFARAPFEVQEHGDFFSGEWVRESLFHRLWFIKGRSLLRRADRVRAVSERIKSDLVRLGVMAERIDVIPVAQQLDGVSAPSPSVQSSTFRVVVPCRFVPQKGLDVLLDAIAELKRRNIELHVSLIGQGSLKHGLERRIASLGLRDRVTILPWMKHAELWNDADLFVLSSRYEGWGRTIVEAMAAGVPIVATEVGCVGSFFRPNIDGLSVEVGDVTALADAIAKQMSDVTRRDAMVTSAQQRASEFPTREQLHERQREGWRAMLLRA